MPDIKDLIGHLAAIHITDRDRSRAFTVAGHLITFVLKDRWHQLSDGQRQKLIQASASRLWNNYFDKRKKYGLSPRDAAEEAIGEEMAILEQLFNPPKDDKGFLGGIPDF